MVGKVDIVGVEDWLFHALVCHLTRVAFWQVIGEGIGGDTRGGRIHRIVHGASFPTIRREPSRVTGEGVRLRHR